MTLVAAAWAQTGVTVGTPPTSWNGYLIVERPFTPVAGATTAPIIGTPTTQTAPAELSATTSALPAGTTTTLAGNGGADIAGNTYQLLYVFGGLATASAIAKTSPDGATTYITLPFTNSRPKTFTRSNTAFYLTYGDVNFPAVYRLNTDGSLTLVINGPTVTYRSGSAFPPTIDADDTITYSVVLPTTPTMPGQNILAAVGTVPYIHPGLPAVTQVPLAPSPALSLSTTVYSSLPLSYQWSYEGTAISGANQPTYSGPFLGTGTYSLVATTSAGFVRTSTRVQLTVAGVVVGSAPVFVTHPTGAQIVLGSSLTLRASAASTTPVSLQWLLDGTPIPGANVTSPSTATYGAYDTTFTATQPGTYTVVATTTGPNGGSVTSGGATVGVVTASGVNVLPSPTIITQPASINALYANGTVTPAALTVSAVATLPMSYQWFRDGAQITGATDASISATSPGSYTVTVSTSAGTVTSQAATVAVVTNAGVAVTPTPTILTQPQSVGVSFGSGLGLPTLSVAAVALQEMSYQWFLDGAPISGATSANYTTTTAGAYTVKITTSAGSVTSAPAVVSLANRLGNISGRFQVGTGANVGIAGFVVSSYTGAAKPVLIRGVGPGLSPFGVSGVLARPVLSVFDGAGRLIASNSGWAGAPEITAAGQAAGAFPLVAGSADAALVLNLAPGAYTAQIAGADGSTGVALAEVYEVLPDAGQLVNISERAHVGAGANILIGGFVTTGSQPSKVLIRAVGPGLIPFGLSGALSQPVLSMYDSRGVLIGVNTGWSAGGSAEAVAINNAAQRVGAFPLQAGSNDCALLMTLTPGAYTAQVAGVNGATGLALIEVYQVP